ncbi:MAG: EAL domain-containing protein [Desulfurobacteriaceae bacterium]
MKGKKYDDIRFIGFLVALITLAGVITLFLNNIVFQSELKNTIYRAVIDENKKRLKDTVDSTVINFSKKEKDLENELRKRLRDEILKAYNVAYSLYKQCKKQNCSDKKIKKIIKETLRNYHFLNGKGYIFICGVGGNVILNSAFPHLEGKNLWNLQDKKGKYIQREIERVALFSPNNEGFVTYYWFIPGTNTVDKKVSFVKLFKPYNWIIGGGFYISEFKKYVKEYIKKYEFTSSNMFFIDLNSNENLLDPTFRKILALTKKEGFKSDLLREGIFLNDENKIYYVKLCPNWNWLIGNYATKGELGQEIFNLKECFLGKVKIGIFTTTVIFLIVSFVSGLGVVYLLGRLKQTIDELVKKNRLLLKTKRELSLKVFKDDLTSLLNRRKLQKDIKKLGNSQKLNFALINIRNFKEINELFGLSEGDNILKTFSQHLKKFVKKEYRKGRVYRLRGDKFGVLAGGLNDEKFITLVKKIIKEMEKKEFEVGDIKFKLDVVAGISNNKENLIIEAEIAEQEAKKRKMDIYVFDEELKNIYDELHKNIVIASKLKEALKNDRVVPVFQPIVNLRTGKVEKYEALMRIMNEEGGFIPPGEFLPVAKKISIYQKLSKVMIEKTLKIAKERNIDVAVSVNLSSEDLASVEMRNWLYEKLKEYDVAKNVCFEIVETEAFSSLDVLKEFHSRIKELEAELAIDDFGSGYSNYEYISIVKPDYIKIDGSLISKLLDSKEVEIIVKHIVGFCKELNIKTIAEFISSEELLNKVKELGIDYGQGFYLGKPEPFGDR